MGFLDVIIAAVVTFAFGALWYMLLSRQWVRAADIKTGPDGKPSNSANPLPYIVSFAMILLVAGMMRHVFALSAIDTVLEGLTAGFGIGAFMISPWLILNIGYEGKPWRLGLINAGYASFGCALMGGSLILFA